MSESISGRRMTSVLVVAILSSALWVHSAAAEDKPTNLSDARAAVESNLRTPEGKAYDERLETEFVQKHLAPFRQCKQSAGDDLRNFWILLKLSKDGAVKEILLYPGTKMGTCAREGLFKDRFPPPPRSDYWVSVYMKLSH